MIMPEVGELIYSVDIVNVTKPFKTTGEGTITSYLVKKARAKVEPIGGSAIDDTQRTQAFVQGYNIWIRYRSGVTPFQQILWDGMTLFQVAPPETFGARYILLHAQTNINRNI